MEPASTENVCFCLIFQLITTIKLTIDFAEVIIVDSTSAGVDEKTITDYNNKASLGGLYPKNFRVDYLFKCF